MPKPASTRSAYKMLTCIYLCRTLLFFAPYADFLEIKVEDSLYPFEVVYISVMNNLLIIRAKETGYFAQQLNKKKDLDLRNLINAEIFIITDEVRIREIKKQSSWC